MKSLFLSTFGLFSALCVGAQTLAPFDRSHVATFGLNNPADSTLRYAPEVANTYTAFEQPLFPTLANMVPYRIPAIAVTRKGTLIAVSDYRPCGADIGFGRVDLRYRLSNDNGQTWSPQYILAQGDGVTGSRKCGYGDAAIVADRKSNEVVVVCVTGNTVYGHGTTTRQNPNRVAVLHSADGGRTWSRPAEITESIYGLFDQSQLGPVQSLFFGSGRICQSSRIKVGKYYRLYAALCARPGGNRVVYSDDFGRTWHSLGTIHTSPAPKGDEPKVEELPNGDVVLSSRAYGGRFFNVFHYMSHKNATGTWDAEAVHSAEVAGGVKALQNSTNGEILIVPAVERATGKKLPLALQSVPLGPGRANVGVYYKPLHTDKDYATGKDFAQNWSGPFQVSTNLSAYSTMVQQQDGRIAFFYEEETYGKGLSYTNMYRPLTLEQITGGKFAPISTQKANKKRVANR
ncbi:MAG: exo-alpha-sialidase [Alloprevotella sp.]|nr:MAG: exo-alpha-sialidase [Alloprevotella sp.]